MDRPRCYILDGKIPVPAELMEWARFIERGPHHVDETILLNRWRVSTIFLGIEHNFREIGPPILFETMIFDDGAWEESKITPGRRYRPSLDYQERYSTWELAVEGHARACAWVLHDYCPQ